MEDAEQDPTTWRTSTFSNGTNCVEVAFTIRSVLVRDSKNRGPVLSVSHQVWEDFAAAIRYGHKYDPDRA
jgi:Domain of unknown function (DUF397)